MGASILEHFSTLEDPLPRIEHGKEHLLLDIVVLAMCAVVCDAENWEAIELFGRTKLACLTRYVPLANGVLTHQSPRTTASHRSIAPAAQCLPRSHSGHTVAFRPASFARLRLGRAAAAVPINAANIR